MSRVQVEQRAGPHPQPRRLSRVKARVTRSRGGRIAWRVVVTVLGVAIIGVGIILLPLPGPGWVIIFAGLGVLSTEYTWAKRLLRFLRAQLARWTAWMQRRSGTVKALISVLFLLVLAAIAYAAWDVYMR